MVGIGPGEYEKMTIEAAKALESSDIIIGYDVYIELVRDHFPGKVFLSTPMRGEKKRCEMAFDEAVGGNQVSVICSGDSGVYGMAGLMYQVGRAYPKTEIRVIPGVTAAMSGAAILGAPLTHDFCLISLSDLLTPWELIAGRLKSAAAGDFVVVIYNPSSMKRREHLRKACGILMENGKSAGTICGIVRNIGRQGEEMQLMSLNELKDMEVDMFTTVFIGNASTEIINGKMVTPRGYRNV